MVSFPNSTRYVAFLKSYFSLQATAVRPACIVSPQTSQDVSVAMSALVSLRAPIDAGPGSDSPCCHFAIRSRGHASSPGASNIAGGVTIDLSGLSSLALSAADPPVLSVGVGSTWGTVYDYLDPMNLSVSGGRDADVGVGGLTLGGGISHFGPRIGWTFDSVVSFEVVLGDGTLVTASADKNPDLLWALRGGGNNLGIVTRVDLQTLPQSQIWGGEVIRPIETTAEQITALAAFCDPDGYDEFAALLITFAYSSDLDLQVVVNDIEYTKPVVNPPVFQAFKNMTALSSTQRITNMSDLAVEAEVNYPNGFRYISHPLLPLILRLRTPISSAGNLISYGVPRSRVCGQASATLTIASTAAAINATVLAWNASIASVRGIPGLVWGTLIIVDLNAKWNDAAFDGAVDTAVRALIAAVRRDVGSLGQLDPFLYINYAAPWQDPIKSYGPDNVARLQRVRRKYDPDRVFTDLNPGGFKIPK
ncbi:hypothetical protein EKO27_g3135 [Xylaria grammica]|uniref:FAD-binding PCMH-type domain-containing protein n=1 Tax=Xylaria grammica TaxID=363999 RepID=A0A439DC24_9PEZI|nr:hypothetical protein EKO27_g3135 [Xylaria grammica]